MEKRICELIDRLRRGEVPVEYKMVGRHLAPAEWTESRMGDIYTERKEPGEESLPILTVSIHSGVSDGALDEDEIGKTVKRIEDKSQYKKAVSGDLVFNMMRAWQGAVGTVRTTGMVSPAYIVARPNESVDPIFMDYYMKTPLMIYTMHSQSYGVTDFRLRLYWDSFSPIKCALPPIAEQQRIASILTAQDKLIELKERLLEEKKQQKKHLMQQLLTGKKRLPGFSGEWDTRCLGELCDIKKGEQIGKKDLLPEGMYYVLNGGTTPSGYIDKWNTNENCISVSEGGNSCGFVNFNKEKFWSGGHCYTLQNIHETISEIYLYAYLKKEESRIMQLRVGSGLPNIQKSALESFEVSYPTLKEQTTIANILSTADCEIDLLQQSIDAEKQKKKALMQLLLTGIVRVTV